MAYDYKAIEQKWQAYWAEHQTFEAKQPQDFKDEPKPPFYVLDMFPYPSGAGLHVGHPLGYIASDIYARYKRHSGYNVLHPQGYDSFGLPAEQYAIQTGQHPAKTTAANIKRYREQLDKIGFSFDWSREVRTSDPKYYKWTQWIFIQLFDSWYDEAAQKSKPIAELISRFETEGNLTIKAVCDEDTDPFSAEDWKGFSEDEKEHILLSYRLTYLAETEVNWCPALGTVLANDEIVNGVSERGGHPVVRKKMKQWSMRISAFAERLLSGLEDLDWSESLKETQRNWIGKSVGAQLKFKIQNSKFLIEAFTTRPDTIYGVSFVTLAPEHELVNQITTAEQKEEVNNYVKASTKRSERDRMADVKTISGVFTGAYAEHPLTQEPIPIWIGDYVLAGYGTGAVMAVPCGDQRDHDFAKHFGIPIPNVFEGIDISEEAHTDKSNTTIIANSEFLNGLGVLEAIPKAIEVLADKGVGEKKINYRLRDAVFSRQRYWGEPFPVYYENGLPKMIDEQHLPLELPEVDEYLPTEDGAPPLGRAKKWYWLEKDGEGKVVSKSEFENASPQGRKGGAIELNTMPGWAGSSWYLFRYMETKDKREEHIASEEALNYWKNVDLYIGGSEHATGHLLYSRFWTKFLNDRGVLPVDEPFKKLINQGMILGESAFVKRIGNTYYSEDVSIDGHYQKIHVDVSVVDTSNKLDIEALKQLKPEFKDADFILNEKGDFLVSREVEKMSKSKFNVVNPDDVCEEYGADSLRLYEMFLGPIEQAKPWNTAGLSGVHNFLKKLWKLYSPSNSPQGGEQDLVISDEPASKESLKTLHKTIKKVTQDIEDFSFNTSVSTFMICVNELTQQKCKSREVLEPLAVLISPYAPHIAEELWEGLGHSGSISEVPYPKFDEQHLKEDAKTYPISFNGKMRFTMDLSLELSKDEIEDIVMADERTQKQLDGRTPKKVIIVPGKIVNIVG